MYIVYKLTGHIQRYGQGCVAMVKMNSKMQSCKEACNWLRSHTWDCEPANGIQAGLGLLLRGVACNRVSWVFSISLTHTQSVSCSLTLSLLLLALPLPSLTPFPPPPRLPIALSQQFFFALLHVQKGKEHMLEILLNILCSLLFVRAVEILYMKQCVCTCSCMAVLTWICESLYVFFLLIFFCMFSEYMHLPGLFSGRFSFHSSTASFTKCWYLYCLVVAWWDSMFFLCLLSKCSCCGSLRGLVAQ